MRRPLIGLLLMLSCALLGACATEKMRSKQTVLDETLRSYAATIRWGDIERAQAFLDPKLRETLAPSALDLARYRQVAVSGYSEQPATPVGDNEVHQLVQIELVNLNTQSARSILDRQVWRYDEASKRWWLVSGLPDISRKE
ncbi:MAG: hypothetical protein GXC76_15565 [Rhodanobacteraceae bacterium]|jgi:hypothetical protein|nr:hypothetical protein [Rhodanobacteraceae bacterium]